MTSTLHRGIPQGRVRIVHLGLGAFHRAHQAWYTSHADPHGDWGIVAFTGRSAAAADILTRQGCTYTLLTRSPEGDRYESVKSIVAAHEGGDTDTLRTYLADPDVAVVTLTVTEKGYHLDRTGRLNEDDADVAADIAKLRESFGTVESARPPSHIRNGTLRTMPGRLVWGLDARQRAIPDATIALIPCDNLSGNGAAAFSAVHGMARLVAPGLAAWMDRQVDVVSTSVDRITPRTTDGDIEAAMSETGKRDPALVVTEPFRDWTLGGKIRGARPPWEDAGATFVDDVVPFEHRKLWMLNGAHSLLTYLGTLRGHQTVADAMADACCAALVEDLWDLNQRQLVASYRGVDLDLSNYRAELLERLRNPTIAHHLSQIAADGSVKLRGRVVEVVLRDLARGGTGDAGLVVIAAWVRFILAETRADRPIEDAASAKLAECANSKTPHESLLTVLSPELAARPEVLDRLTALANAIAP